MLSSSNSQFPPAHNSLSNATQTQHVLFGAKARNKMLDGVNRLAKAVAVTMGPKGKTVVIEQSGLGTPKVTKDGVTVAKNISFSDHVLNLGAQLVRDVAISTNATAGDGTTTATVLAQRITADSFRAIESGAEPNQVVKGIERAVKDIIAEIEKMSTKITTKDQIRQVASVSANNSVDIGKMVSDAFEKVGNDGVVTIQDGKKMNDELEIIEGMNIDSGYLSHYFVTDQKSLTCEFSNPFFLVCDHKLTSASSVVPVLQIAHRENRPLVIIADSIDGDALTTLLLNKLRGLRVVAVRAPSFGEERRKALEDIALVTGAKLYSEEIGDKIEECTAEKLGTAKQVKVSQNDTLILQGKGEQKLIKDRCDSIRHQISNPSLSEYEREKLKERLSKLTGGIAVIKVGGTSEAAVGERRDRLEDALHACRAAMRGGVVPGGGVALLRAGHTVAQRYGVERHTRAIQFAKENANANANTNANTNTKKEGKSLKHQHTSRLDTDVGEDIVIEATKAPLHVIAANAGKNGSVIEQTILSVNQQNFGYDANNDVFCDIVKSGIIDPTFVVKTAFHDAAEVASVLASAACVISEQEQERREAPPTLPTRYDE